MPDSTDPQTTELIDFINTEMAKPIDHPEFDLGIELPIPSPRPKGEWIGPYHVEDIPGPAKRPYHPEGHVERIAGLVVEDIPEGKGLNSRPEVQVEAERAKLKPPPPPSAILTSDEWPPKVLRFAHTKPPPPCHCGAKFISWEECFAHRHAPGKIIHYRTRGKP